MVVDDKMVVNNEGLVLHLHAGSISSFSSLVH